ncbi:hypothetical protein Tco_1538304 [Tanacetum coccineum]
MVDLKFADTHNLVAFLSKPAESEGFEQIVVFLNANPIRYALMINLTIYISCIEQFWSTVKAKTVNGEVQLQALVDGKKIIITESTMRRDLQLEDAEGVDFLPNSTIFEQLTLMGSKAPAWNEFGSTMTFAVICLATNQKFNFSKYIFESIVKNLDNMGKFLMYPRVWKGFSGRETPLFQTMVVQVQKEMGEVDEAVYKELDDSLERAATTATSLDVEQDRGNINKTQSKATPNESSSLGTNSGGGPRHQETMGDTIAQTRFKNVSKHSNDPLLARDGDEVIVNNVDVVKTAEETRSVVEEVTAVIKKAKLVSVAEETVNAAATTISTASTIPDSVATTTTTAIITDVEITLAQALAELKSVKPKANKVVIQEPEQCTTTTTPTTIKSVPKPLQDKGKGIMIEEHVVEQVKPMKRLEQMRLDEELAFKLQAEEEEEERLVREKAQQIEEANIACDDVQAKIEADYQLAQRLQAQEKEELVDEEKARLFLEENSKKAEAEIAQESSSKRAREELEQESSKKQKVEEDKESEELKQCLEIVPNDGDDVTVDATPLSIKSPTIEDFKTLWKLIKAKYGSTRPMEDLDLNLWGNLKIMFEPYVEDRVWRNQQYYRVLDWKLYDSCGVHSLRMQHMHIHMLVEKIYPLTPAIITDMLNKKLQADHFSEMAYQLFKLLTKPLKNQ